MEWTDHYSIGVRAIDDQHELIFNQLDWLVNSTSNDDLPDILAFLSEYITNHFVEEEKLMAMIKYVDIRKHVGIHRAFQAEIEVRVAEIERASGKRLLVLKTELAGRTAGWLIEHIATEDYRMGLAVKEFTDLALRDVDPQYLPGNQKTLPMIE